jgi:hypothetical protein
VELARTDRFLCRGVAEWQLIAAHNLLKLWRASLAQAATAIPEPLADRRDRRQPRRPDPKNRADPAHFRRGE